MCCNYIGTVSHQVAFGPFFMKRNYCCQFCTIDWSPWHLLVANVRKEENAKPKLLVNPPITSKSSALWALQTTIAQDARPYPGIFDSRHDPSPKKIGVTSCCKSSSTNTTVSSTKTSGTCWKWHCSKKSRYGLTKITGRSQLISSSSSNSSTTDLCWSYTCCSASQHVSRCFRVSIFGQYGQSGASSPVHRAFWFWVWNAWTISQRSDFCRWSGKLVSICTVNRLSIGAAPWKAFLSECKTWKVGWWSNRILLWLRQDVQIWQDTPIFCGCTICTTSRTSCDSRIHVFNDAAAPQLGDFPRSFARAGFGRDLANNGAQPYHNLSKI